MGPRFESVPLNVGWGQYVPLDEAGARVQYVLMIEAGARVQ